jgi:hypothetical protein
MIPMISLLHAIFAAALCNLHIEEEKEDNDSKDEYNLNNPFIDNEAVEGKEEDGKDQDGNALMDTP